MYYTSTQASPNVQKLAGHHDSPWNRHHLGSAAITSPQANNAYSLYGNGTGFQHHTAHPHAMATHSVIAQHHQQQQQQQQQQPHHQHHHHQNSLTHTYPSPPAGHIHPQYIQGSPANGNPPVMTQHWQQQLLKYDIVRVSRSPHHRARQSALAARPQAKAAIPITDPNRIKPPSEVKDDVSEIATDDHPSSTTAPVAVAPRPTASKPENSWTSLDMGGIGIKILPSNSGLFSFTFLQTLYLNHNALTSIPAEITHLKHLELLDLSGNALTHIPSELGMLCSLKELYLFDNQINTLPPELGFLHQLQTLGIEGNPLDASMKAMIQKDGTPRLIAYLRDNCPMPSPPPEREWHPLPSERDRKVPEAEDDFTVVCYNILCERCATERLYGYTPSWALSWEYRRDLILQEINKHNADFLCLQEVDIAQYEDFMMKHFADRDYEGVFWPKSRANTMSDPQRRLVDGCAIFFKSSKYQLVEKQLIEFRRVAMQRPDFKKTDDMFNRVLQRDNIAVVALLENKATGGRLIVANLHLHWDHQECDVKLVQVALLIDEIDKIAARFARYPPRLPSAASSPTDEKSAPSPRPAPTYSDGTKIPLIVCGDFNSIPDSGVYEFLANGTVPSDHPDFMSHVYGNYTSEGLRHRLGLKSAYATLGEHPLTNYTASFHGEIDYIWYSTNNLTVTSVYSEVDTAYLSKVVGFPNVHFPSDHVCIASRFRTKPPKEVPSHAPPVFPSSSRS